MIKDNNLVVTASATVTSDTATTGVSIPISGALYGNCVVKVTACDGSSTDETYFVYLEVRDGTSWFRVGGVQVPRGYTGDFNIPFHGPTVKKVCGALTQDQVRINIDVGGTTPSITAESYITFA